MKPLTTAVLLSCLACILQGCPPKKDAQGNPIYGELHYKGLTDVDVLHDSKTLTGGSYAFDCVGGTGGDNQNYVDVLLKESPFTFGSLTTDITKNVTLGDSARVIVHRGSEDLIYAKPGEKLRMENSETITTFHFDTLTEMTNTGQVKVGGHGLYGTFRANQ